MSATEVLFAVVIVGCVGSTCDIEQPTGEKFASIAACRWYATTYTPETERLRQLMTQYPDHTFTVSCRPSLPTPDADDDEETSEPVKERPGRRERTR
jgi:hypothetical protein